MSNSTFKQEEIGNKVVVNDLLSSERDNVNEVVYDKNFHVSLRIRER